MEREELKRHIQEQSIRMVVDTAVKKSAEVIDYLIMHGFSKDEAQELITEVMMDRYRRKK